MGKSRTIINTVPVSKNVTVYNKDELSSYLYKNENVVIDFSYKTAFCSCEEDSFNNFLQNEKEFILQFRSLSVLLGQLAGKTLNEIMPANTSYRHCHKADNQFKARNIIKRLCDNDYYKQNFENEDIYQIGLEHSLRLYGTIASNVFHVAFIDYFHTFDYKEAFNRRNLKNYNFCPIKTLI